MVRKLSGMLHMYTDPSTLIAVRTPEKDR